MTEPLYAPVPTYGPDIQLAKEDFECALTPDLGARIRLGDPTLYLTAGRHEVRSRLKSHDSLWLVEQQPGPTICMRWLCNIPNANPKDERWADIRLPWVDRTNIAQILDAPLGTQ